ncbi:M15 family metallopeptidase [Aeromicrobium wangtongii]|uniref:M15 family metallopeptidase n=1 Tax=Aeromicrobium wangtongii TaxID=2969247 RepID=A0ABY5M5S4_9ACTN|nr:M15 family metallopeptidase [Aeromicrobium wangtongii]MCD9198380.1 M15 family metallopeptidase [Aeromicrobium wangtongii]UUP12411.1 M15 family metallopeptidase [Aeromicrobium wangtongii]
MATATRLDAPQVTLRRPAALTARVTVQGGAQPPAGGAVRFEQQTAGGWIVLGDAGLDASGTAVITATFTTNPIALRATYLGVEGYAPSTSAPVVVAGAQQPTTVGLDAPRSVTDERTLRIAARVTTPYSVVPGAAVTVQVYRDKKWRTLGTARTNDAGVATVSSKPRVTYKYRAIVAAGDWYTGARSSTVTVTNVPPGKVVKLPSKAPKPRKLPAQPRASGDGPNPSVSTISDPVWKSMKGRSWRAGCPVGRSQLRLVRINYWGFDGYRHRGELVVHRSITGKTVRAFSDLYRHKVPIRAMYRVDRFGYSKRLRGANDYASMAADNTSAFNCRDVIGRKGVRSPHAYGRAIDINAFENPYRYRAGKWVPNTWWRNKAAGAYAWTKRSHLVPTIMRRHGFRWPYGKIDGQHFAG